MTGMSPDFSLSLTSVNRMTTTEEKMGDIETIVTELIVEAEARHKEKANDYYQALQSIIAICEEHGSDDFNVIRMIAGRAIAH